MASNFVWYELMTSDLDAAENFYKTVVGWNTEPFPMSDFKYIVIKAGDRGVGGLMTIPQDAAKMGARPSWIGYIYAPDVDTATSSIKNAGGKVYREPTDIPNVGRFAVVTDPQGAAFALLSPQGPDQPRLPLMAQGNIGWRELYANDGEKAFDFYAEQFGWAKDQAMDMGPMGTYQLFSVNGEQSGGIMNRPEQVPVPMWLFYFNVGDIDAAAKRVTDNGGQVLNGPMEVPGGAWVVQTMDPQGAMFALVGKRG